MIYNSTFPKTSEYLCSVSVNAARVRSIKHPVYRQPKIIRRNPSSKLLSSYDQEKRNRSKLFTYFRFGAFIACTCALLYQVSLLLNKYFYGNPSMETKFMMNSTLAFPAVSVCPAVFVVNPSVLDFVNENFTGEGKMEIKEIFTLNQSVELIWNASNGYIGNITAHLHEGFSLFGLSNDIRKVLRREEMSPTGRCSVFNVDKHLPVNQHTLLVLFFNSIYNLTWIQVVVHSENDVIIPKFLATYRGHRIKQGKTVELFYHVHETRRLNRTLSSCKSSAEVEYCQQECIIQSINKSTGEQFCRLPFLPENRIFTGTYQKPLCKTADEIVRVYNNTDVILRNWNHADCQCPQKCTEISYNLQYVNYVDDDNNSTKIHLRLDKVLAFEREYESYTADRLLSDIGGSMGLYLGICLMTVVDILEYFVENARKTIYCFRKMSGKVNFISTD